MWIEKMLRMYLLQIWFHLSDPATEDAIYDSYAMRKFTINRRPGSLARVSDKAIDWERHIEYLKSFVRCKVEHVFRIIKCQFGYRKTVYRGLRKDKDRLPHDFPPYSTVYSFYRSVRISGLWDKILEHLVQKTRTNAGRKESPNYAIIDSQSVKTAGASEERGIDGGKKRKAESGTS